MNDMARSTQGDVRFWDRIADKYFRSPIAAPDIYEDKLRRTQARMQRDMIVLEFGCGTGGTAVRHSAHVARYHAIDVSDMMLDHARRQAREAGVRNLHFERADISDYPMPRSEFDMILGLSILHLVRDLDHVLEVVWRGLRPGGTFVSNTACLGERMGWFRYVAPIGRALGRVPFVRVMTEDWLISRMEAHGFEIEERWQPGKSLAVFVVARKPES